MTSSGLNVEHLSKDSFISLMRHIIDSIGVYKVYISEKEPAKSGALSMTCESRIDIPLSGRKHIAYASRGRITETVMEPGELHYCPPFHWKWPLWDYVHEMSSIIYNSAYIRITYINFSQLNSVYESRGADIYYHTSKPLNEAGSALLRTLNLISEHPNDAGVAELITGLLKITLEELKKDTRLPAGKADLTKLRIKQYIQENFYAPINRAHVAQVFGITPSYISRLFTENGEENFNHMLRRLRFEHSTLLLKNTNMSLDEITDACGYLSSTYFIAAFKKHFGISPGRYRRINCAIQS